MDSWCSCTKETEPCKGCRNYQNQIDTGKVFMKDNKEVFKTLAKDEELTVLKEDLKPRVDLVPPEAILGVATILAHGAEKHGARSWEKGMAYSDNYAACQRHLLKWYSGETYDHETGKSHLWHAATRLFFLIGSEIRGIGTDDRPIFKRIKETSKTDNS